MSTEDEATGNGTQLPDGWQMYDKYQLRHTDGTPLKGKRYFVLRLDSDDPAEASRVAAAMAAYKGEQPGNGAAMREALEHCRNCAQMIPSFVQASRPERSSLNAAADYANLILRDVAAALAKPARNCDRPECKDIQSAMNVYRCECCEDGPLYVRKVGAMHEAAWLLAPATERKGDTDGN